MNTVNIWIPFIRILLSCLCGAAVGFERTRRLKEAGIRTHCIIASAAALVMLISKYGFADTIDSAGNLLFGTKGADPARLAAQVISGISFLGAGVIFRNGSSVKGLTTAAGIWATAAIGLAIGCGMYMPGLLGTAVIVIVQTLFHRYSIGNDAYSENEVQVVADDTDSFRAAFEKLFADKQIQILAFKMERRSDNTVKLEFKVRTKTDFHASDAIRLFSETPEIRSITM